MFDSLPEFDNEFDDKTNFHGDDVFHPAGTRPTSDWEAIIRDAGDYVRPGDQLRGRILDAVSNRRQRRQRWRRCFGTLTLATSALLCLIVVGHIGRAIVPRGRSVSDLHEQAAARASSEGIAWEWALTEVVYDWRRSGSAKAVQTGYRHHNADAGNVKDRGGSR